MPGPPKKPSHLKVVQGTYRKDRASAREPHPARCIPPCPKHLSPAARKAWKRVAPELDRMGVLTRADGMALELLVDAYAEFWDAREQVAREGATYVNTDPETGAMQIKAHPAVRIASDAWRRVRAMAQEFGLTPAARPRVHADTNAAEEYNPFRDLAGGAVQ